jgi:hypothetical protein
MRYRAFLAKKAGGAMPAGRLILLFCMLIEVVERLADNGEIQVSALRHRF